jgi:hypothetical protein
MSGISWKAASQLFACSTMHQIADHSFPFMVSWVALRKGFCLLKKIEVDKQ